MIKRVFREGIVRCWICFWDVCKIKDGRVLLRVGMNFKNFKMLIFFRGERFLWICRDLEMIFRYIF